MASINKNNRESEKWLEKELVRNVAMMGGKALKFASAAETGFPDRLCLLPYGQAFWVEVKSKGKEPKRTQLLRIGWLNVKGYPTFIVDDEESLTEALAEMMRTIRDIEALERQEQATPTDSDAKKE